MSQFDPCSDQDILVQDVQGQPKIETSVESGTSPAEGELDSRGIMKTVDVSTSVMSLKS